MNAHELSAEGLTLRFVTRGGGAYLDLCEGDLSCQALCSPVHLYMSLAGMPCTLRMDQGQCTLTREDLLISLRLSIDGAAERVVVFDAASFEDALGQAFGLRPSEPKQRSMLQRVFLR